MECSSQSLCAPARALCWDEVFNRIQSRQRLAGCLGSVSSLCKTLTQEKEGNRFPLDLSGTQGDLFHTPAYSWGPASRVPPVALYPTPTPTLSRIALWFLSLERNPVFFSRGHCAPYWAETLIKASTAGQTPVSWFRALAGGLLRCTQVDLGARHSNTSVARVFIIFLLQGERLFCGQEASGLEFFWGHSGGC